MKKTLASRLTLPAFVVASLWFVVHFGLTIVYLAPMGELKATLQPVLFEYIDRHFSQGWNLFAPDPQGSTKYVQVACKLKEAGGTTRETPLYDVSNRFYKNTWQTRLGPNGRTHRAYVAPAYASSGAERWFAVLAYRAKQSPEAAKLFQEQKQEYRTMSWKNAAYSAMRSASMECQRQFPDASISEVRSVIDVVEPPAFHTRGHSDEHKSQRLDFGWQPYERTARLL